VLPEAALTDAWVDGGRITFLGSFGDPGIISFSLDTGVYNYLHTRSVEQIQCGGSYKPAKLNTKKSREV
jgi:hypothetical protein